jgi:hypothetical protein
LANYLNVYEDLDSAIAVSLWCTVVKVVISSGTTSIVLDVHLIWREGRTNKPNSTCLGPFHLCSHCRPAWEDPGAWVCQVT